MSWYTPQKQSTIGKSCITLKFRLFRNVNFILIKIFFYIYSNLDYFVKIYVNIFPTILEDEVGIVLMLYFLHSSAKSFFVDALSTALKQLYTTNSL